MSRKIVAGNWKMNLSLSESESLCDSIKSRNSDFNSDVILFAPYIYLIPLIQKFGKSISIGAQNGFHINSGAYTGEVSFNQLKNIGVNHVLIGHSERREIFKESDDLIAAKIKKAIELEMNVVFCCGEGLEDRQNNNYFQTVAAQLSTNLFHLNENEFNSVSIAYEPIWAIGTGNTASAMQAEEMHEFIRQEIIQRYSNLIAQNTSILYGGSCNEKNAKELFGQNNIDGGLIGGASLNDSQFVEIIMHNN